MDEKFRDFERKGRERLEMKNSVIQIHSVKHLNRLHQTEERVSEAGKMKEILHSNIHKRQK